MTNSNSAAVPRWLQYKIGEGKRHVDTTDFARALITGPFGTGKTYFANTFPKPFFIDVDYGMSTTKDSMTAKASDGVRLFRGDPAYETIMALLNDAKNKKPPLDQYESLILDSLTSLSKLLIWEISGGNMDPKKGTKLSYDEYGSLKIRLADIMTAIQEVPYHVCVTALTLIDKDEATGSYVGKINTVGSFGDDIGALFDEVYYIEKRRARSSEPGDVAYEFHTQYHPRFDVKSRLQNAAKIPAKIVNPTFSSLYGHIYNKKENA